MSVPLRAPATPGHHQGAGHRNAPDPKTHCPSAYPAPPTVSYPNHVVSELLSTSAPATDDASIAAGRTLARLARQVELGAATAELSLSQYRVLVILDSGQEAASTLADKLAVSRPSITGVVDGLCGRGLVCRHHVDGDRRRVDVQLTEAGAAALAIAEAEIGRRLSAIAAYMEPGTADPLGTLAPWRTALNAYRKARHGSR
jgi:DNA-binding MarR family transcriptional regulator